MLIILRTKTKRLINLGFKIVITVFVVSIIISHLVNSYQGNNVIREGWLREDKPSGNSMRVEKNQESLQDSNSNMLDEFVVQLKGFYRKGE